MIIFLDSNIVGLLCNNNYFEGVECRNWFFSQYSRGSRFFTSDICIYEVRRGLLKSSIARREPVPGLLALQAIRNNDYLEFLSVSTEVLDLAAEIWAEVATGGRTTRDDKNIDVDIIISAHYQILVDLYQGQQVIVATKNLKHISQFCAAANWQDIRL
jgi:predicted nucleic acid-binding protein